MINLLRPCFYILHSIMLSFPVSLLVVFLTFLQSSKGFLLVSQETNPDSSLYRVPQPQPCPRYAVISHYNPTSGSIFANEPSVTLFTNAFFEALYKNDAEGEILREVLDVSQTTPKEYRDFFTKYALNVSSNIGVKDAAVVAEFGFRAIPLFFDVLRLPVVARAFANCVANFLFVDGFLKIDNAKDLGLKYAHSIADSAKVNMNLDPKSKFLSLCLGYINFFISIGLFTKEKLPIAIYYFGNEWFVAAVNYRFL